MFEKGMELLAVYLKEYRSAPLVDTETGEALELPLDGVIDVVEEDDTVVELKTAARNYTMSDVSQNL